jgi:polysaccharide biosynthesis protein PslH
MKVAFVSLYEAYPPASGAAYVTYNCARLAPFESLLVQLCNRTASEKQPSLIVESLRQRGTSRLAKLLGFPSTVARIQRAVKTFKPDCIVVEGASWAVYLALIILVLRKTLRHTKIAYHAHNVEFLLRVERNGRLVAAITRLAEKYILTNCDISFAVSEDDRQRFRSLYGVLPSLLPNGVDCSAYLVPKTEIDFARAKFGITDEAILFMGLYGYPPNTEAVRFLVDEVMPELHRRRPNIRLVITGGGPPISPPWLIQTGVVSRHELNAIICACRIGSAPIFWGSGTRLKILEYMAASLPVVSTRKGAEGLNLEAGKHVLYAETASEFQGAILNLLSDATTSQRLAQQASILVRSRFDWIPLLRQFAGELESAKSTS